MYIRFLKGGKNQQYEYVVAVEGYRDKDGRVKQRTVERLGRKDLLLKDDPDAIEKLKKKYGGDREEKDQRAAAMRIGQTLADMQADSPGPKSAPVLNYGYYPVRALWKNLLGLHRKFDYEQKHSRLQFNLGETACFLAASKILHPASVLDTFHRQDGCLGTPILGVPLDSLYDLYGIIKEQKDSLMKWAGRALASELPGDRNSLVFYDVTNAYFESALTDAESGYEQKDYQENFNLMVQQARAEGELGEECFDGDGEVIVDKLPPSFLEGVADERIRYLRMRGPSKEHRYDLPIVSVALVIDKYGVPLDFEVFAGNTSEFMTMEKAISRLQSKYRIRRAIVVADRGLNSGANLRMLQEHDLGFLMAQKITNLGKELTDRMLDGNLYQWFDPDDKSKGRYQMIRDWEKNTMSGTVKCTLVFTYNEKRRKRDEAVLSAWREIVLAKQKKGEKVKPKASGWSCLAKIDNDLKKGSPITGVDEREYEKRLSLCGYAALIYREAPGESSESRENQDTGGSGSKTPEPDSSMLSANIACCYHQLNQIEDCFRVMKTNLGLRPMFVRNSDHIKGHICICVLALILVRIIQRRLRLKGYPMSINRICRVLGHAEVMAWRDPGGQLCLMPRMGDMEGIRRGNEGAGVEELTKMFLEQETGAKPIDRIMEACGLSPLRGIYGRNELSRALGTKFKTDKEIVGPFIWEVLNLQK